jgi:addiction module HigA family antidote
MNKRVENRYAPTDVSPPGDTLREILNERSISQAELAHRMGRPQKTISEIINGKAAITPETALELELVLSVPANFWIARESGYRTYRARHAQEEGFQGDIKWARKFPIKHMAEYGWIPCPASDISLVRDLLEFLGIVSGGRWQRIYSAQQAAFRKSSDFMVDSHALSAWLRAGIASAETRKMKPFNRTVFMSALREARNRNGASPEESLSALSDRFSAAGVAVTFIPRLPKSRAIGATMWLSPNRALIQLGHRCRTDNELWSMFFHEAAHLLLHGKRAIFLESGRHLGACEQEATEWATSFLTPNGKNH